MHDADIHGGDHAPPLPSSASAWEVALHKARHDAFKGGLPAYFAMLVQVVSLMWLRTTINYQYSTGVTTRVAFRQLYAVGGVRRFYSGLTFAIIEAPLARCGDVVANAGVLSLVNSFSSTSWLPMILKTCLASMVAVCFRLMLMPLDAMKTSMQVRGGVAGRAVMMEKIRQGGIGVLWHGSGASAMASFTGHFPWFTMFNVLNGALPMSSTLPGSLVRSAFIGFCASLVSDTCSNSLRVLKTVRQTSAEHLSYRLAMEQVLRAGGVRQLLFRGLGTKIASNSVQSVCFSVLWRLGQHYWP